MTGHKERCRFCGAKIASDLRFCPRCSARSPFAQLCPNCFSEVEKGQVQCLICGQVLTQACPACGQEIFVGEHH